MNSTTLAQNERPSASRQSSDRELQVQPYLFFGGRCEEALNFYRDVLGAEITALMRFKDSPPSSQDCPGGAMPVSGEKIMHASFRVGGSTVMASDGCENIANFQGFSLALSVRSDDEARRAFAALSAGGQVLQPLIQTFFSSQFGMATDRFGVSWMIVVAP